MSLSGSRTYVGFGFGAIQAGLFLYEAFRSGNFRRLVVAEVMPDVVDELRGADGFYSINIAHPDRIETVRVGPIEACNPAVVEDTKRLIDALGEADEIGTAVPSVECYATEGVGSLHRVLAAGLKRKAERNGPRAVVYAAENHNRAAEILEELIAGEMPADFRGKLRSATQFLNTVIGKMSGQVGDPGENRLTTMTPHGSRAFLVEAFNRILVSRVRFAEPFARGIAVFEEKDDLLPFEEAKLFGHNATHALGAYLGRLLGIERIAELRSVPGFIAFLRDAFVRESGGALIRRHRDVDALFTKAGYAEYADDLIARMTNPFLMDTVERVGRDLGRKLSWDDRLIGTMRLVLSQGIEPRRYALGAAAGLAALDDDFLEGHVSATELTEPLWKSAETKSAERQNVLALIERGRRLLHRWRGSGFPNLHEFFGETD